MALSSGARSRRSHTELVRRAPPRPGGRLIFPWRPTADVALAAIITRTEAGFAFRPLMPSFFISCVGASTAGEGDLLPDRGGALRTNSVWLCRDRAPDDSATAIYRDLWFSSEPLPAE